MPRPTSGAYSNVADATTLEFTTIDLRAGQCRRRWCLASVVDGAVHRRAVRGNVNVVVVSWNDTTAAGSVGDGHERQRLHARRRTDGRCRRGDAGDLLRRQHSGGRRRRQHRDGDLQRRRRRIVDVRIAEYAGISAVSPVEATAAAPRRRRHGG